MAILSVAMSLDDLSVGELALRDNPDFAEVASTPDSRNRTGKHDPLVVARSGQVR
jgi:hypothetical protein